jgi:acetyl-CoA carboxylase biotin carboxyl carrier protein
MDDQSKKKIRELADLLSELGLGEIEVKSGEHTIRVAARAQAVPTAAVVSAPPSVSSAQPGGLASRGQAAPEPVDAQYDESKLIRSPFVGTYYESPAPGSDAFVKIGQQVSVGQTLCIVEAMKLMNEIEADKAGEVVEILVNNEDPVEFDQPLFLLK